MSKSEKTTRVTPPKMGPEMGFLYPLCWMLLEGMSKCSLASLLKTRFRRDLYVVVWSALDVASLLLASTGVRGVVVIVLLVCAYRYVDVMTVLLSKLIRGFIRYNPLGQGMASANRTLLLLLINGLEVCVLFAVSFISVASIIHPAKAFNVAELSIGDAVYFSAVTATTLGFGDISPVATMSKILVVAEVLSIFLVFVVVVATVASQRRGIENMEDQGCAS